MKSLRIWRIKTKSLTFTNKHARIHTSKKQLQEVLKIARTYLELKLKEVFIKTTNLYNNESTIYGNFGDEKGNRVLKPLQVVNYVYDEFLT